MRQIKYRAWHNILKEMFPVFTIYLNYKEVILIDINDEDVELTCYFNEVILMQNTGIIDRNGIEIYEGDLVEIDNTAIGGIKGIAAIEWLNDFTLLTNPGFTLWMPPEYNDKAGYAPRDTFLGGTVIGNIYEGKK